MSGKKGRYNLVVPLRVRISEEMLNSLTSRGRRESVDMSDIVRAALQKYLRPPLAEEGTVTA